MFDFTKIKKPGEHVPKSTTTASQSGSTSTFSATTNSTAGANEETVEGAECTAEFEPVQKLINVEVSSGEDSFVELAKLRARLYRFDKSSEPHQFKERGTGHIRVVFDKNSAKFLIFMRRDQTLKICSNHYILKDTELKPMNTSEKSWVWYTPADFSDGKLEAQTLACRFTSMNDAKTFKTMVDNCRLGKIDINDYLKADSSSEKKKQPEPTKKDATKETKEDEIKADKEGKVEEKKEVKEGEINADKQDDKKEVKEEKTDDKAE